MIQLIPDYDQQLTNRSVPNSREHFHEDVNISIPLFNDLLISYRWRPLINDALIADLKSIALLEEHQSPEYIFIGWRL